MRFFFIDFDPLIVSKKISIWQVQKFLLRNKDKTMVFNKLLAEISGTKKDFKL